MRFTKATKIQQRLRMALAGPAGSGKTYTSLQVATAMGGKVGLIDTEHRSSRHYSNRFDFQILELDTFSPDLYIEAIKEAGTESLDILIIDGLSQAWTGKGGELEMVDQYRDKFGGGWRNVTPLHNELVNTMLSYPGHLIATMRTKVAYEVDRDTDGKVKIRKLGLAPIQREGLEYEFDVFGELDLSNDLTITKTRCDTLQGRKFHQPGALLAAELKAWLATSVPENPKQTTEYQMRLAALRGRIAILWSEAREFPTLDCTGLELLEDDGIEEVTTKGIELARRIKQAKETPPAPVEGGAQEEVVEDGPKGTWHAELQSEELRVPASGQLHVRTGGLSAED